jgi:hypothetical protein
MAEGDQDQGGVAVAVAAILGGRDQPLDFLPGQVFPPPQLGIGGPNWN